MKIFKAEPNETRANENHWKRSPHKGWIIVRAENEEQARRVVSSELDRTNEAGLVNPWDSEDIAIFTELTTEEIEEAQYSLNGEERILDKG